ncbi:MAG: N-acetylmuramoyl-L-alanine amidase family protein [Thermodesulfovibrionales bacterium]
MKRFFPWNKEQRVRKDILRGVYEENLRIVGKGPAVIYRTRFYFSKRLMLPFLISLMILMFQESFVPTPMQQRSQITANTFQKAFQPAAANVSEEGPSNYKSFISSPGMPMSRIFGLGVRTIMIDPGHGGNDTGTKGEMGTKEKDIALDIAKRLRDRLKKYGNYNIVLTRDSDTTLTLNRRVELAKASKADLFLSIHLNYLPSRPINIIETYYFGPSSDPKILKLAEQENTESSYGNSDFREIIGKIGDTMKLQESKEFAASIQKKLFMNIRKETGTAYNFGVKRAPFVVLLGVDVPSVLAEVSCLSSREEEVQLNTESHRENIARYLELGILDYLNKGEVTHEARRHTEK